MRVDVNCFSGTNGKTMPRGPKGERRLAPHSPLRPPYPRRPSLRLAARRSLFFRTCPLRARAMTVPGADDGWALSMLPAAYRRPQRPGRCQVVWGSREGKAAWVSDTFTPPGPLTTSTSASRSCASALTRVVPRPPCQWRAEFPQLWRSKIPQFGGWGDQASF
jgi:hypothetical protein